jgi:cytochrome c-type biogenesis protein CcmH
MTRAPASAAQPGARLLMGCGLAALVIAVAGYAWTGSPGAAVQDESHSARVGAPDLDAMVAQLAQRMERQPDPTGLAMLGRSYLVLGNARDSVAAYRRALALQPNDASLLADAADAMGVLQGGRLDGEAAQWIDRALAQEPAHPKALALAMAAARRGERSGAPPASPRAEAAVSGTVTLAAPAGYAVSPTDAVFVFARAPEGPGPPLAVLRKQVKDLPLEFRLDDSLSMSPQARLSDHRQVIVAARISKSGSAVRGPGDLEGTSPPVAVGSSGVRIELSRPVHQVP